MGGGYGRFPGHVDTWKPWSGKGKLEAGGPSGRCGGKRRIFREAFLERRGDRVGSACGSGCKLYRERGFFNWSYGMEHGGWLNPAIAWFVMGLRLSRS